MHEELVSYIRKAIADKHDVATVLAALKSAGHSETDVNQAFQVAMSSAEPTKTSDTTQTNSVSSHFHFSTSQVLVSLGGLLVVIAVAIVLSTQWQYLGPFAKFALIAIPNSIIFGLAAWAKQNPDRQKTADALFGLGVLFIALTIGAFFVQFGLVSEFGLPVIVYSTGLTYLISTVLQFMTNRHFLVPISLIMLCGFVITLLAQLEVSFTVMLWAILFVALAMTGFGYLLSTRYSLPYGTYTIFGAVAAGLLLPGITLDALNRVTPGFGGWEFQTFVVTLFGFAFLAIASFLGGLVARTKNSDSYTVKRAYEEIGQFMILFPVLSLGFSNDVFLLFALLLSFGMFFASIRVPIRSLLPLGAIGVVSTLLSLTGKYFSGSVAWPILLFLAGFALIGLSILVKRVAVLGKEHHGQPFYGLGVMPDMEASRPHTRIGVGRGIFLLIVLYLLFQLVTGLFFYL